jgi:hypothetical protein
MKQIDPGKPFEGWNVRAMRLAANPGAGLAS